MQHVTLLLEVQVMVADVVPPQLVYLDKHAFQWEWENVQASKHVYV